MAYSRFLIRYLLRDAVVNLALQKSIALWEFSTKACFSYSMMPSIGPSRRKGVFEEKGVFSELNRGRRRRLHPIGKYIITLYTNGKLRIRVTFLRRAHLEGGGLRVADSHTGNHREDAFTPLETFRDMEDDVDISALTIEQYIALIPDDIKPGIVNPKIGDDVEFEINANFMRELQHKLFVSTDDEDAYEHVRTVLEIVDLFHFPGVTHDEIMLRVFLITLKGRALRWKNRLPAGTIITWDLLRKEFIWRYYHPFITAKKLEKIRIFKQERDETLYHAWERYNDLLYQCLLHDLNYQQKVHILYTGLGISTRKILGSNGFIPLMTPTQALESIQVMADHSHNKTSETVRMNGNPEEIHNAKAQDDKGDIDVGWDITNKDVERLMQFLTPTIHTLPNLEPVVQPYIPLGPVHDMDKVVKEKEHDYDIPLNNNIREGTPYYLANKGGVKLVTQTKTSALQEGAITDGTITGWSDGGNAGGKGAVPAVAGGTEGSNRRLECPVGGLGGLGWAQPVARYSIWRLGDGLKVARRLGTKPEAGVVQQKNSFGFKPNKTSTN
ncbi:reverse transcriptase domain-containing protein [Tanacetum coccineum]